MRSRLHSALPEMARCWVLVLLMACSQRTPIRHAGSEIGERGEVKFRDGQMREATFAGFSPGGVVVNDGYRSWEVPYAHLDSFETTTHAGGAWQGLKWGDAMAVGAVVFGLTGAVFGIPIGAIAGKTTVYAVDEREWGQPRLSSIWSFERATGVARPRIMRTA